MSHSDGSGSPEPFIRQTRKRKVSYREALDGDDATRPATRRRTRSAATARASDSDASGSTDDQDFNAPQKKPSKRKYTSRSKLKSRKAADDSDEAVIPDNESHDSDEDQLQHEDGDAPRSRPKIRPRKSEITSRNSAGDGSETARKSRRKQREAIPIIRSEDSPQRQSVDPSQATMAELCDDPGVGRLSSRHEQVLEGFTAAKQRRKEHRLTMLARTLAKQRGEAVDGEPDSRGLVAAQLRSQARARDGDGEEDFDYDETVQVGSHQVAQVRLDVDGNIVLDEDTTQVDRAADPNLGGDEDLVHIEENDHTRFVNSGSHTKKVHGARWSKVETELFYDALAQFGTDFQSIALALGTRPRSQVKAKFNREDRLNPQRITDAMKNRKKINLQLLAEKTGRSFDGPVPEYGPTAEIIEAHKSALAGRAQSERATSRRPSEAPSVASGSGTTKGRRGKKSTVPDGLEIMGMAEDFDMDDD